MRRRVHAGFEPPAYIASLIAAINDGARAAQTGGLFVLAIAVYLMATVISTSDEVLLRGTSVEFSQLGVKIPVLATYALAPVVFLFLHVHTLIRYDMLAENLRLLDGELRTTLSREPDRERCRQLLANVEFVQYWSAERKPYWHSLLYKIVVVVMLVVVPVLVFLATQISFLRYQNGFVTGLHLFCLALDLTALVYFWYRQARRKLDWQPLSRRDNLAVLARTSWFAAWLFVFATIFLVIPPPDSKTTGQEAAKRSQRDLVSSLGKAWIAIETGNWSDLGDLHPLDSVACPFMGHLGWGCRHLRLDHRLLVAEKPDSEVLYKLRTGDGDLAKLLIRVEALFLRERSFRFADFSDGEFYDADLVSGDLRGATLSGTSFQNTNLTGAILSGTSFQNTNLTGADFRNACLRKATLRDADMEDADFRGAYLGLADLRSPLLAHADFAGANLQGADLRGAFLAGANFAGANLRCFASHKKDLHPQIQCADLTGANLDDARFPGADLSHARGLTRDQLAKACGDEATLLPKGLALAACPDDGGRPPSVDDAPPTAANPCGHEMRDDRWPQ